MAEVVTTTTFSLSDADYGLRAKRIATELSDFGVCSIISAITDTSAYYVGEYRLAGSTSSQIKIRIGNSASGSDVLQFCLYTDSGSPSSSARTFTMIAGSSISLEMRQYGNLRRVLISQNDTLVMDFAWILADIFKSQSKVCIAGLYSFSANQSTSYNLCDTTSSTSAMPSFKINGFANYDDIGNGQTVCVATSLNNCGKVRGVNGDFLYCSSLRPNSEWTKFYVGSIQMLHIAGSVCVKV